VQRSETHHGNSPDSRWVSLLFTHPTKTATSHVCADPVPRHRGNPADPRQPPTGDIEISAPPAPILLKPEASADTSTHSRNIRPETQYH
jgi:hypothetical protein